MKAERKERTADARAARERNAAEAQMLRARELEAWLQGHITRALAERDAHWREVHIEVLATQREDVDAKLAHLQLKIDALSAELNKQRAIQEGSIADLLPPVPQRKRNAAASETIRRRAFMDGFRAGLRHRDRAVRELIDSELKQFETRCDSEEKRFGEALAAATRAALHRLQGRRSCLRGATVVAVMSPLAHAIVKLSHPSGLTVYLPEGQAQYPTQCTHWSGTG